MAKSAKDIMAMIKEQEIEMVDFKMVDINGQFRHVTIPAANFTEDIMTDGVGFDASNYGYAVVEKSDMVFIPDPDTAMIDPFCDIPTLSMTGNAMVIDYPENKPLTQYPRNIVKAAEQYMKDTGIADTMLILPEFEFYLFDNVGWEVKPEHSEIHVDAMQAHWNSDSEGLGNIVPKQKNYHIVKPFDTSYLAGYTADRFDVAKSDISERAERRMRTTAESIAEARCSAGYAHTYLRGGKLKADLKARYLLLPAYLFSIKYGKQDYFFAVNGQTGKVVGNLPSDKSLKRGIFLKRMLIILALVLGFAFAKYMMGR